MTTRRLGFHAAVLHWLALFWLLGTVGQAISAQSTIGALKPELDAQLPTWLWGEWSRNWILRGKSKSSSLDVHYLQTPTYFADIRIPKARPSLSDAKSFADLTDQQLRLLAAQVGLTGLTTLAGNVVNWSDEIAFQPYDGTTDTSRLERRSRDVMHEVGLDGSFTESWRRVSDGSGQFLVVRVKRSGRLMHSLVVVGDRFVYVRNRAKDLPPAPSLEALIETTKAHREEIVEYLDCEFSAGRIHGGSMLWEIQQSTLPWREGHHLEFADTLTVQNGGAALTPKAVGTEQWSIPVNTLKPSDIRALFIAAAAYK